jgi:hypothetical protein
MQRPSFRESKPTGTDQSEKCSRPDSPRSEQTAMEKGRQSIAKVQEQQQERIRNNKLSHDEKIAKIQEKLAIQQARGQSLTKETSTISPEQSNQPKSSSLEDSESLSNNLDHSSSKGKKMEEVNPERESKEEMYKQEERSEIKRHNRALNKIESKHIKLEKESKELQTWFEHTIKTKIQSEYPQETTQYHNTLFETEMMEWNRNHINDENNRLMLTAQKIEHEFHEHQSKMQDIIKNHREIASEMQERRYNRFQDYSKEVIPYLNNRRKYKLARMTESYYNMVRRHIDGKDTWIEEKHEDLKTEISNESLYNEKCRKNINGFIKLGDKLSNYKTFTEKEKQRSDLVRNLNEKLGILTSLIDRLNINNGQYNNTFTTKDMQIQNHQKKLKEAYKNAITQFSGDSDIKECFNDYTHIQRSHIQTYEKKNKPDKENFNKLKESTEKEIKVYIQDSSNLCKDDNLNNIEILKRRLTASNKLINDWKNLLISAETIYPGLHTKQDNIIEILIEHTTRLNDVLLQKQPPEQNIRP